MLRNRFKFDSDSIKIEFRLSGRKRSHESLKCISSNVGIKISSLTGFTTPGSDQYMFLNERLGMFYKAARSRAQANGKVSLNHRSIRHLKVKRQSFIVWGEVKGEWRKAGRGQGTFWSCRLSISGHMLALMSFKAASEILPNTLYVSPKSAYCLLQHLNTTFNWLVLGKQTQTQKYYCKWLTHFSS